MYIGPKGMTKAKITSPRWSSLGEDTCLVELLSVHLLLISRGIPFSWYLHMYFLGVKESGERVQKPGMIIGIGEEKKKDVC